MAKQHSHRVLTVVTRLRRGGSNQRLLSRVSSRRTRLDFTSFFRFFLAMADVSDLKINEGAFVNPIIMHFQSLTNLQHMRMFVQTNPKSTGFS